MADRIEPFLAPKDNMLKELQVKSGDELSALMAPVPGKVSKEITSWLIESAVI